MPDEALAPGSATPEPAPAAAPIADTTPQAQPAGEKVEGDKPETDDVADAAKATEAAKALAARKQTAAERIAEVTRQRREAERRAERAEREAADLRGKLKEPDPASYDDLSKLNAAQVDHTLDKRAIAEREAEAKRANQEADAQVAEAWQERVSVFKETAVDFDEVALKAPISDSTARDIARMEEGPQIAYYLGKHPAEARALNSMSERDRATQLGRLAGKLTVAPPRRISTAPTPVDAIGGKGAQTGSFDPKNASMDEYVARRKAGWKG